MKIDKEKIKKSFSQSAPHYDQHALLQWEMAEELLSRLSGNYRKILDIGSGTGKLAGRLAEKYPAAEITGLDIAPGMVAAAASSVNKENVSFLVGDGEELPFKDQQFDLVVSSASLQWMNAEKVIAEAARALTPDGRFLFSTFGPATLSELRRGGLSVNRLPSKEELEKVLRRSFRQVEISSQPVVKCYNNVYELFFYLKEIGAQNPQDVKQKGLLTKRKLNSLFLTGNDDIKITFELFFGACVQPILD